MAVLTTYDEIKKDTNTSNLRDAFFIRRDNNGL